MPEAYSPEGRAKHDDRGLFDRAADQKKKSKATWGAPGDAAGKGVDAIYDRTGGPLYDEPSYGGGGSGGGGGGAGPVAPVPFLDPMTNPLYLGGLADIDAAEATSISGIRARQDAARRALADALGDITEREGQSNLQARESQETRGLLRSGATERLLMEVAKAANSDRANRETGTADDIADLERAAAEASAGASRARANARLSASGAQGLLA